MVLASNNFNKESPEPADITQNSPDCGIHRSAGYIEMHNQAIGANVGQQNFNLFQVTGLIELKGLWGVWTDVTNVATLTGAYFDLWDGANTVPLTAAAGVDCSGGSVGSAVAKIADDATAATFLNASQCRYGEDAAFRQAFFGGLVLQMAATNTYIRFRVTTDGATDCDVQFWCVWVCRQPDSLVAAV